VVLKRRAFLGGVGIQQAPFLSTRRPEDSAPECNMRRSTLAKKILEIADCLVSHKTISRFAKGGDFLDVFSIISSDF
jgi:hypothetical protein